MIKAIEWVSERVRLLDQTRLPQEEVYLELTGYREIAEAIVNMRIRGAPAIGIAAAYGLALGALEIEADSKETLIERLHEVSGVLASTRPTAVNLFWALDRMKGLAAACESPEEIRSVLIAEAVKLDSETQEAERALSTHGAGLIEDGFTVLTHCNTGALAAGGYGTALGVIRTASEGGKRIRVLVDETRPLLQGARLTTWELSRYGIPFTLITDSMAGFFMSRGEVDAVIVGADRIASNGDTANKIGTYSLAVLAKESNVPFYVAAPVSTIDSSLPSGDEIPIEERTPDEITSIRGIQIAPEGVEVSNPAFDITPHRYITAIITEKGVIREPFHENL